MALSLAVVVINSLARAPNDFTNKKNLSATKYDRQVYICFKSDQKGALPIRTTAINREPYISYLQ